MTKQITINKVVSKSFILDIIARVQNVFGHNLTSYEAMIDKGVKQIVAEIGDVELSWYRYEITQLTNGAVAIMLYGERK